MNPQTFRPVDIKRLRHCGMLLLAVCALCVRTTAAQELTGTLIGTVKDPQGAALAGATVRVASPALIGGPLILTTDAKGQLRFSALPPGDYVLDVELKGFASRHEEDLTIRAGITIERSVVLHLATVAASVIVEGTGSQIDVRDPGFSSEFGADMLKAIPIRRTSMFDAIRVAPGISPTSPTSGTATTVSAFGSGTNENQFLFDGTNFTCPCNGVARAEPGIDFIRGIQVQSVGASAEYGNFQGAVINVVTRQGSEQYQYDASYYLQTDNLTSAPVRLSWPGSDQPPSGYARDHYGDFTTNLGGPAVHDRLWFFGGYQNLRDYDSQPGTDPAYPRRYEEDKVFGKLTWKLTRNLHLEQSFHGQFGLVPDRPTIVTQTNAISRRHISVPAITFGHLTYVASDKAVWDVRVGRFVYSQEDRLPTDDLTAMSHLDRVTGVTTVAPQRIGDLTIMRTTAKATLSLYQPHAWADHEWRVGGQFERGEHDAINMIPNGMRFVDNAGQNFTSVASDPAHVGGLALTASAFASDAITIGGRLTINAGVRYDHSRAVSPDLHAVDISGHETDDIVLGLGTLYTWNIVSPRLGMTLRLTDDGRTVLRGSYGRFSQGVLTGELEPFHPGAKPTTTMAYVPATGTYSRLVSIVDPNINLRLDRETRAPHTDEYSVGIDRELGHRVSAAIAYVRKNGTDFIGWNDEQGKYLEQTQPLPEGQSVQVFALDGPASTRRFLLTNQKDYAMRYDGLVMSVEKRRSDGWQLSGSYTYSRASGVLASSGTSAAGAQVSTVSPPSPLIFGRDPNDLTNAEGRLPNDRPHMFRIMGSADVPHTGMVVAASVQAYSGKPWAATAQILLPQGDTRVQLEPRGTQRLSTQSLLDLRLSRPISLGAMGRSELFVDVLNVLNDTAEESLASDTMLACAGNQPCASGGTFGQAAAFVDPRRAMFGVRLNLGR